MELKEEIKSRLSIDQVVGQYCQIKKKGRNFVSLCPFHNDKNPSFLISPDKGIAYCFACQSGGDIFSFVQKIENVDFPSAVKILCEKAGIDPEAATPSRQQSLKKDEKKEIRECLSTSALFYKEKLSSSNKAISYLDQRKIPVNIREKFQIGYAPDSFSETYEFLLKKGLNKNSITESGLVVVREIDQAKIYDRFRDRLMFPIRGPQGDVLGFGGRTLGQDDAKYINSPDGPLYKKSSVLFGLYEGKEAIRKTRTVILVEGYFDVLGCHIVGIEHVVAACGTALTEEHIHLMKRYADRVVLCMDSDRAGTEASKRAFELLTRAQLPVSFITLTAKDPGDLAIAHPDELREVLLSGGEPYLTTVLRQLATRNASKNPDILRQELFPLLQNIQQSTNLRAALEEAATLLKVIPSDIERDYIRWSRQEPTQRSAHAQEQVKSECKLYSSGDLLLGLTVIYPSVRSHLKDRVPTNINEENVFVDAVIGAPQGTPMSSILDQTSLSQVFKERIHIIALYCEENFPRWTDSLLQREFQKILSQANRETIAERLQVLVTALQQAREAKRSGEEMRLLVEYQSLLKLRTINEQRL